MDVMIVGIDVSKDRSDVKALSSNARPMSQLGRGRGKTRFAGDGGPTSMVRSRRGLRADADTQARIACSSGPTPMIAITGFML
jgi:hypothetical protein